MNEDEFEELHKADFLENAQADIDDLMSGRIKSPEHLEAAGTLVDKLCELSSSIECVSEADQDGLYNAVNSKSIDELKCIFNKIDEFRKWFEDVFEIEN